jgi:hypothetical protein
MSVWGKVWLNFADSVKKLKTFGIGEDIRLNDGIPSSFGKIDDFSFHVDEFKLFRNGEEKLEAGHIINAHLNDAKEWYKGTGINDLIETVWQTGLPLAPFPMVEACLGLSAKDSSMEIKDGYAVMSFDYDVKKAESKCILNLMGNTSASHARRMDALFNS